MQSVTVTIGKKGVNVEVNGMAGGSCKDATAALEKALGKTTGSEEKPEFYQEHGTEQAFEGGGF